MTFLLFLSIATALPLWGLMILHPRGHLTRWLLESPRIIIVQVACYGLYMLSTVVQALFTGEVPLALDDVLIIAWLRFLPFDLFIGRWILLDGEHYHNRQWMVSVILILTLLMGPFGFGAYFAIRQFVRKSDLSPLVIQRYSQETERVS